MSVNQDINCSVLGGLLTFSNFLQDFGGTPLKWNKIMFTFSILEFFCQHFTNIVILLIWVYNIPHMLKELTMYLNTFPFDVELLATSSCPFLYKRSICIEGKGKYANFSIYIYFFVCGYLEFFVNNRSSWPTLSYTCNTCTL